MATPLDAERERLRANGHTDSEISQILIARETTPQSQQAATGAVAPMSGVLNNVGAVLAHARGVIPALQTEMAIAGNSAVPASRRFKGFTALALMAAVVALLAYGVSLELNILQNQSKQTAADAAIKTEEAKGATSPRKIEHHGGVLGLE
jgi:hypothetical protein